MNPAFVVNLLFLKLSGSSKILTEIINIFYKSIILKFNSIKYEDLSSTRNWYSWKDPN